MVGTLITAATLWLLFNVAFAGVVLVRAGRRKRLIRETTIDRLMAAHFAGARNAHDVTVLRSALIASLLVH